MKIRNLIFLVWLLLICSCSKEQKDNYVNSYELAEILINEDCSIYSMNFIAGNKVLFKLSTSGSCISISTDSILESYEKSLNNVQDQKLDRLVGKVILLEIPSAVSPSKDDLERITLKVLKHSIEYSRDSLANESEEIALTIIKPTA